VALVLASAVIVALASAVVTRLTGVEVSEHVAEVWKNVLMTLVGGLIGYIGGHNRKD
jgi:hypothetical protein